MSSSKTGVIIQARTGSSRLPRKMTLQFYKNESLLEILLDRFKEIKVNIPVILATSVKVEDDILANIALRLGFEVFRGEETNVLKRFIDTAEFYDLDRVVRVCADNPFIQQNLVKLLIQILQNSDSDYTSWWVNNTKPSIKTHSGFFAEAIKVSALKRIAGLTSEPLYLEHVTNYIYGHPERFSINWIPIHDSRLDNVRLTIDTIEDFNLARDIYNKIAPNFDMESVLTHLDSNKNILQSMKTQITKNEK